MLSPLLIHGQPEFQRRLDHQLLVGPVTSLSVPGARDRLAVLNWASTDATAVGFNVYRNGVQQNASLLAGTTYTDNLPLGSGVQYGVTAVNNSSQESPARQVNVYPVALGLLVNPSRRQAPAMRC